MTYDAQANAAMIYLEDRIEPGAIVRHHAIDMEGAEVVLDFGADGLLLGIEVMGARAVISTEALGAAERIG